MIFGIDQADLVVQDASGAIENRNSDVIQFHDRFSGDRGDDPRLGFGVVRAAAVLVVLRVHRTPQALQAIAEQIENIQKAFSVRLEGKKHVVLVLGCIFNRHTHRSARQGIE